MPRFVVLSDLHYDSSQPSQSVRNWRLIDKDLDQIDLDSSQDYFVFLGDLVRAGSVLDDFENLYSELENRLQSRGFDQSRRISIPGNHEVCRKSVGKNLPILKPIIAQKESISQFAKNFRESYIDLIRPNFENYSISTQLLSSIRIDESNLTGYGTSVFSGVSFYLLNSALISAGGLDGISDEHALKIDIDHIYDWVHESKDQSIKVLLMHHSVEDLHPTFRDELKKIIDLHFDLVVCGHRHAADSRQLITEAGTHVSVVNPAAFAADTEHAGYSILHIDPVSGEVVVEFRQLATNNVFVPGSALSGTPDGKVRFRPNGKSDKDQSDCDNSSGVSEKNVEHAYKILCDEFESSVNVSSSKGLLWVEPDVATAPEYSPESDSCTILPITKIVSELGNLRIKAPPQFGLSTIGKFLAKQRLCTLPDKALLYADAYDFPNDATSQKKWLNKRLEFLQLTESQLGGVIIDNCGPKLPHYDRMLAELAKHEKPLQIIVLERVDDQLTLDFSAANWSAEHETYYLWALDRSKVRQVVEHICNDIGQQAQDDVVNRVIKDLSELNLHRTAWNVLSFVKIILNQFDRSPVNKTQVLDYLLIVYFSEYHRTLKYSTIPDIKDAQYAVAEIAEKVVRSGKNQFTKIDFYESAIEYCKARLIELDIDILFNCLLNSNIIAAHENGYRFRFTNWIYYFAAHSMINNEEFYEWVTTDKQYMNYPLLIEYYTGIDRKRADLLNVLVADLRQMNHRFEERTGIDREFQPFNLPRWKPDSEHLDEMQENIAKEVRSSALPTSVKDRFADRDYDRSLPYRQELSRFVEDSFGGCIQVARATAFALRNSEHVDGELKLEVMDELAATWRKVAQVIAILTPDLAQSGRADFEGHGFVLTEGFFKYEIVDRIIRILSVIPYNISNYTDENVYSPKMAPLYRRAMEEMDDELFRYILVSHIIKHRPNNWREDVYNYIKAIEHHSVYMMSIMELIQYEFRYGFLTDGDRRNMAEVLAYGIGRQRTGSRTVGKKKIESMSKKILDSRNKEGKEDG